MTSVLVLFLQLVRIFIVVSPPLISHTRSMFVYVLLVCIFLCVLAAAVQAQRLSAVFDKGSFTITLILGRGGGRSCIFFSHVPLLPARARGEQGLVQ